ncbi:MAG: LCP family protein [Candidatus Moranbacteria bacterium]|nr:LCP family protein [Candidatus Moranbacteria bacterium]
MDSLRKKPIAAPPEIPTPAVKKTYIPHYSSREELYIPKEETLPVPKVATSPKNKNRLRKILWLILLIIVLSIFSYLTFFLWKTYAVSKKMNVSSQTTFSQDIKTLIAPVIPSTEKHFLQGEDAGRVNILLMGAAGEHQPGGNLTDTIMIMSIDTKNKKIALLSLPRDFYVPIPQTTSFTKINSLYKIGVNNNQGADLVRQTVEKITDLKINYYVTVDFAAFEKIIDDIGGVNIISSRDIYDARYPGPNYSYQTFSLAKGAHLLDGKTALQYVRERHDDPEGDFGRAKRQQQVIQAVKNRVFSAATLLNVVALNNVLDALGNNVKTDMSFDDIDQFIQLSKTLDTQNITNVVVDAWKPDSLLKVSHVTVGNVQAFILVPRVGNYSEIQDLAKNIFDQNEIKKRQDAIVNESANIAIINQSGDANLGNKIKKLLSEKLGMKDVHVVSSKTNGLAAATQISANVAGEGKIFTLDELIKKLPASLDQQKNSADNDITITLGSDLIDVYKYEEDSIDDFNKAQDDDIQF